MKIKQFFIGCIVGGVVSLSMTPTFASTLKQKIEVLFNDVSLFVNNEQVVVDNFLYNGTTYVPLRSVAQMAGMTVDWKSETKRVDLNANKSYTIKYEDSNNNRITSISPKPLSDNNYLKWGYLLIDFNKDINRIKNISKVILSDNKGNNFKITSQIGVFSKNTLLIIPTDDFKSSVNYLDTYYSLYIPKDLIEFTDGQTYGEDILLYFKTATNAIRGNISSSENHLGEELILKDIDGNEYKTRVVGKNEFYLSGIPEGKYDVVLDNKVYNNILVEANKINTVKIIHNNQD